MKCGHCGRADANVTVDHVWNCSQGGTFKIDGPALQQRPRVAPARKPAVPSLAETDNSDDVVGLYLKGSMYYKVQISGSGNLYAKAWNDTEHSWDYAGRRPLYALTGADKVSAADAARFGALTGECINCGKRLTDERSIDAGYGPTCAANNGWPWGETKPIVSAKIAPAVDPSADDTPPPWYTGELF